MKEAYFDIYLEGCINYRHDISCHIDGSIIDPLTRQEINQIDNHSINQIQLTLLGYISSHNWDDDSVDKDDFLLKPGSYIASTTLPKEFNENKTLHDMLPLFLEGKYLNHDSITFIKILEYVLVVQACLVSTSILSPQSYVIYKSEFYDTMTKLIESTATETSNTITGSKQSNNLDSYVRFGSFLSTIENIIHNFLSGSHSSDSSSSSSSNSSNVDSSETIWRGVHSVLLCGDLGSGKSALLSYISSQLRKISISVTSTCTTDGTSTSSTDSQSATTTTTTPSVIIVRGLNRHFEVNSTVSLDIIGPLDLLQLFFNVFHTESVGSPSVYNSSGNSSGSSSTQSVSTQPMIILFDNMDRLLLANKPANELNGSNDNTFTSSNDNLLLLAANLFNDSEVVTEEDLVMVQYASLVIRRLLSIISQSSTSSSSSSSSSLYMNIFIFGTASITPSVLPLHATGAPQFEKVINLSKPKFEDRLYLLFSILFTWHSKYGIICEDINDINSAQINFSDFCSLFTESICHCFRDIKDDLYTVNMYLWASRIAGLTLGYLPGDLTYLMDCVLTNHRILLHRRDIGTCIESGVDTALSDVVLRWSTLLRTVSTSVPRALANDSNNSNNKSRAPTYSSTETNSNPSSTSTSHLNKSILNSNSNISKSSVFPDSLSSGWHQFGGYPEIVTSLKRLLRRYQHQPTTLNISINTLSGSASVLTKKQQSFQEAASTLTYKSGIVIHGPSGVGKTFLASIIASETKMNFISIKCPELLSPYFGQVESSIRGLFSKARATAPSILFFDDFDCIAGSRSNDGSNAGDTSHEMNTRVLSTFLNELDGVTSGFSILSNEDTVLVIVACQNLQRLDSALIRPGRLHLHYHLHIPGDTDILDILRVHLLNMPLQDSTTVDCSKSNSDSNISDSTEMNAVSAEAVFELLHSTCLHRQSLTGADISGVCKRAKQIALSHAIESMAFEQQMTDQNSINEYIIPLVTLLHFKEAISDIFMKTC